MDTREPLFPIKLPKHPEVEIILIRLADGTIVARTREELEQSKSAPKEGS